MACEVVPRRTPLLYQVTDMRSQEEAGRCTRALQESTPEIRLVGSDVEVPLVTGGHRRYVNLDYAASAPALVGVREAVERLLPWYSSVHRGTGFKSMVSTAAYEGAREAVASFVGARPGDTVIFTRNTTDAANLLASAVPAGALVVTFESEHHANLLPWRNKDVCHLPVPPSPSEAVASLRSTLSSMERGRPCLVALTGASNVTGEIWPVTDIVAVAHHYGAKVFLDAAQLAPHRLVDIAAWDVDYVAISGHKLYAPYGAGALVGRTDWLEDAEPFLAGGGAVSFVASDEVLWAGLPDRQEAGSPNVIGAVALGVACRLLQRVGMATLAEREEALLATAEAGLRRIPGFERYSLWGDDHEHIGTITFNLAHLHYAHVASALSAEHGIGVRHGCFCAHPLMLHLLDLGDACANEIRSGLRQGLHPKIPGALRASFGLGTTLEDVERFVEAVEEIATTGPRWTYRPTRGGYEPDPDPRAMPSLGIDLAL